MPDEIDSIPTLPVNASAIAPGTPDRNGVPFDPARHIPRQHPRTGRWLPKGGRKPKSALPSSASTSSLQVNTDVTPEAPPPSPSATSPAASPAAPAPSFDDIERAAGPATPPPSIDGVAPAATAEGGEPSLSPEATGELGARALYGVTGALIGDHKAATATGAEHANIKAVATAYARARGIKVIGGLAVGLTVLAFLMDDRRRETVLDRVKALFRKKPTDAAKSPVVEVVATAPTVVEPVKPREAASPPHVPEFAKY